jgi:hypothetical protein
MGKSIDVLIYPSPSSEFIAVQASGLVKKQIRIELFDCNGTLKRETIIPAGSTISYIDTQTLYSGTYFIKIIDGSQVSTQKITITH